MKEYAKPEIEIIGLDMMSYILGGSNWGVQDDDEDDPSGIGTGGDDGPAPGNVSSLWDE